jgi:hypothetical protein
MGPDALYFPAINEAVETGLSADSAWHCGETSMKTRIERLGSHAVLALAMALSVGCGVDEAVISDPATSASADGNAPLLATTQQPLIVVNETYHHGGNLWEQNYEIVRGTACGAGKTRNWASTSHTGGGNCWVAGWASADITDCHVRVHIKDSGGWVYGDCTILVDASATDSCASRCGQRAPDGCYCDESCRVHGDCCRDYSAQCR